MTVRIVEAPHFEKESLSLGATRDHIRASRSLVQAALEDRKDIVSFERIKVTLENAQYRPWWRIKGVKSGIRVAVEIYNEGEDNIVLIHAVIPRDAHTYDEFEKLWKQYRSLARPPE